MTPIAFYVDPSSLSKTIASYLVGRGKQGKHPSKHEELTRWHLASLFMTKVFDACAEHNVTPMTADGQFSLNSLMLDAERELDIHISETSFALMDKTYRERALREVTERRQFAYSSLIRMTSNGFIK
jgi:hypothetical protein